MLYEIKLKIKEYATLTIYTTSEKIKDKLVDTNSTIKRTIPVTSIEYLKIDKKDYKYFDSIIINNSDKRRMNYDKNYNVTILDVNESELRFPDLVYISLSMFSKILARTKKYLLHSSSLKHSSDNCFVLVGEANSGKTSLGYELMENHDCKLISNDHSIIGVEDNKAKILGGTKEIQMRLGAIELYFPELSKKVKENLVICDDEQDSWSKKIVVNDIIDSSMILDGDNDKTILSDIFNINTTNSGDSFIRQRDKIDEFLFLYESMSKIIKGTYNYITGFNYPMPSMEDEKILYELSDLCNIIVEQCSVSDAKGSIKDLAKELVKKYEK